MKKQDKSARVASVRTDETNRSQNVFIAVGLAIVIGGLWLLYDADGPYHPDIPVTDRATQGMVDG